MPSSNSEPTLGAHNERFIPFEDIPLVQVPGESSLPKSLDVLHGQLDTEERERVETQSMQSDEDHSEVVEKDLEVSDKELESRIFTAIGREQYDLAYDLINQVKDSQIFERIITGVITSLVSFHYMDEVKRFAALSKDPVLQKRNMDFIKKASSDGRVVETEKDIKGPDDLGAFRSADNEIQDREELKQVASPAVDPLNEFVEEGGNNSEEERRSFSELIEPELSPRNPFYSASKTPEKVIEIPKDIPRVESSGVIANEAPAVLPRVDTSEIKVEAEPTVDEILEDARHEYARELSDWKNEVRKSKGFFSKVMSDFGVDKKLPKKPEPEDLVKAREAYIEAKSKKFKDIIEQQMVVPNQAQRPLGLFEAMADSKREDLIKAYEEESAMFYAMLSESALEKEKSIAQKGIEWWQKMNPNKRRAIASSLVFGSSILGGAGLYAAATYTGYRAAKSFGKSVLIQKSGAGAAIGAIGTGVAQGVGAVMDMGFNKVNLKKAEEAGKEYVGGITMDNFAQKEKEMMDFSEKMKEEKKKQLLQKAMVKTAVAGATSVGLAMELSSHVDDVAHNTLTETPPHVETQNEGLGGPVPLDAHKIPEIRVEVVEKPTVIPTNTEAPVLPTQVELTSKGFIQDIHNLKASILAEYHDKPIPEELKKNILDKPSLELAKKFHFYDAEHNASGVGLRGESLGVDEHGNIFYKHLSGDKQVIFDSQTGKINPFDGKMDSSDKPELSEKITPDEDITPDTEVSDVGDVETEKTDAGYVHQGDSFLGPKNIIRSEVTDAPVVPVVENEIIPESATPAMSDIEKHIPLPSGKYVDVMRMNGGVGVLYDGVNIGHEEVFLGNKMVVLNDEFQDGAKFAEARSAFVTAFEKTVKAESIGPTPIAENFEGGKIYISYHLPQDPDQVRVLLNGKEIATGKLVNGVPKISLHTELKGGLFYADNAYERAFKHINNVIKQGLKNGAINFTNH